jgi:Zn-dependent protease with chaperone function
MRPNPAVKTNHFRPRIIAIAVFIPLLISSVLGNQVAVPTPTEQAVEYHNISNIAWGINQILTLLLPVALLILGLGTRISTKLKNRKYLTLVIFATIFFILKQLLQLPLERIRTNNLNQIKNDANLPVLQWTLGEFLQSLPLIIISILLALLVYWLINKSPQRWWLWATCVASFLFLVFLVVEPFTFSHKPLGETPLEVKISELAKRSGIPRDSIVLENCEPFDSCDIAHVSGLGPTRIILLNKGLLDAYPESWTLQTFAHESKHYVKDDNLVGWVVLTLILLGFFFLLDRVCLSVIRRFSKQLGFTSIGQPAALPLMILVLNVMYLIALPPINVFRQQVEFEADRYGLELTKENQALAEMASSWTTKSKTHVPDPSPFFVLFRSSHPSDATRITFANEYQSEDKKE